MSRIEMKCKLSAPLEKLMKMATDFEVIGKISPIVSSLKILEKNEKQTITEEIIVIRNHEITQQTAHRKLFDNKLGSEVLTGPFKGTTIQITFERINDYTEATINAEMKLSLKYKFFEPIIKKKYKNNIMAILYRINTRCLDLS